MDLLFGFGAHAVGLVAGLGGQRTRLDARLLDEGGGLLAGLTDGEVRGALGQHEGPTQAFVVERGFGRARRASRVRLPAR